MIYFITGGSRGIGANLVKRVVEAGHDAAFTYVHAADQAEAVVAEANKLRPEANCRCYKLDLSDREQIESVIDQVVDDFDTIDVVVNNAGMSRDSLLMSMTDEEWDDVIAANLTGPFLICRAALPTLIANRYGRIINISSVVAEGATGQTNYAASKAGLHGLTKSIAKEYGRKRITANVVLPGFFETDMTREHMPEEIRGFWKQYAPVPKGRGGELDELAAVIMFLASKEASFVNGQEIRVTGGLDWNP